MPTESEFIRQLTERFPARPPVTTGIGDDGAVLGNADGSESIVVTDMLLDGVHFDLIQHTPELVGRKAVAVNLSDLAAMGCRPTAAFLSIAVPSQTASTCLLDGLYAGIESLANQYQFTIAGGDTNSWDGPLVVNACLTGTPFKDHAVLRSGARPGDLLIVSGPLGGSLHSDRHLRFEPRLRLSECLSRKVAIHAMIDVSDGLAIDLHRMMEASGTGAGIRAADIPIHADVSDSLPSADRLAAALSDGEDFELLIAIAPDDYSRAISAVQRETESGLTIIGRVEDAPGCRITDETEAVHDLPLTGWQHRI